MDIFKPAEHPENPLPVIIYIHGGALILGSKELSSVFCCLLAKEGFLVFSLEYRLIPKVRVYEQFADVCAGMDFVNENLASYSGDSKRVYIVAESAGAYLATYVTAMQKSENLQHAVGYKASSLEIKAMGLISGMFYTTRTDRIGFFLSRPIYGYDKRKKAIAEYTNPEHSEIIHNLPPCYLVTSEADFLKRHTLDYAVALKKNGNEHSLLNMGNNSLLLHAFPVLYPELSESKEAVQKITEWLLKY